MTIEFSPAQKPVVTRTRESKPNPYAPVVDKLIEVKGTEDDALSFTHPTKTEDEVKALGAILRLIRKAGTDKNVTVRVAMEDNGKGITTVTVWATDKIKRERKPVEEQGSEKIEVTK